MIWRLILALLLLLSEYQRKGRVLRMLAHPLVCERHRIVSLAGKLQRDDLVRRKGDTGWTRADAVAGLFDAEAEVKAVA